MAHYRCYFMNGSRIQRGDDMECSDDDAAQAKALALLESAGGSYHAIEVWERTRKVGRYERRLESTAEGKGERPAG